MITKTKFGPERHLDMIQHPERWPHDPILPVKRGTEPNQELGLVFTCSGVAEPTVHVCNLFDSPEAMGNAQKVAYPTLERLLADGWEVD
jgi:hypothetical protein